VNVGDRGKAMKYCEAVLKDFGKTPYAAAYFGVGTLRLVKWGRSEVTAAKVFMGLFSIVLAVSLIWLRIR